MFSTFVPNGNNQGGARNDQGRFFFVPLAGFFQVCRGLTNGALMLQDEAVRSAQIYLDYLNAHKDDGLGMEDLLYVTTFTGLRQGEVLGLTWDCIDFNRKTMRVYRQLQKERKPGGGYDFASLKNDKQRSFMIADNVLEVLRRVKVKQTEWKLKAGKNWDGSKNLVFTDEYGHHLSKCTVYENFKRCAREAGIPETRFHDLRHTYATLALEQGTDIKTVSSNLGHATVAFTLDVYGHVTEQMQRDSADRMQKYLESL